MSQQDETPHVLSGRELTEILQMCLPTGLTTGQIQPVPTPNGETDCWEFSAMAEDGSYYTVFVRRQTPSAFLNIVSDMPATNEPAPPPDPALQ